MEDVRGKTLGRHIAHKGLRTTEVLKYAVQIADALAAAHEAGIVHRDLKPGKIMITERGAVKLVDFGLAKLAEPGDGAAIAEAATRSLEADSPLTEDGVVMGTAAYMSPEQAQGLPIDARSDIFSFGAVLYEMITGRRAFKGANRISTITALLRDEPPPLADTPDFVPSELERAIRRCLRKDREKRIQHMADLKLLLEELKEDTESGRLSTAGGAPAVVPRRSQWLLPALAVACVCLGVAGSWWALRKPAPQGVAVSISRTMPDTVEIPRFPPMESCWHSLPIARAMAGQNIWIKQVPAGEPVQITHAQRAANPDFSPDGTRLVYELTDDHSINVIPALGDAPRRIASPGYAPRFSPDGTRIAYLMTDHIAMHDEIRLVSSSGRPSQTFVRNRESFGARDLVARWAATTCVAHRNPRLVQPRRCRIGLVGDSA